MKKRICLGLMSGTSVDAIDASLVLSGESQDHVLLHMQFPYTKNLRNDLLNLIGSLDSPLAELTRIHYAVGAAFAESAEKTIKIALQKKILKKRGDLVAIGSHGQTVFHNPEARQTLQIGEAAAIAVQTGITTVSDFRVADTEAGGEGAPLLPLYHERLFAKEAKRGIAIHNLGGISNFTYLGPKKKIFALDTGPANCLMDLAIQKFTSGKKQFDEGGEWARTGNVHNGMFRFLLDSPNVKAFRTRAAPKSTGRELFSKRLLDQAMERFPHVAQADILRTLTAFSIELIMEAYDHLVLAKRLPLEEIVFCGGGTGNTFLLELLGSRLPKTELHSMEDFGLSSQALESQAFGVFALFALDGKSISHPNTTGANARPIAGKISPGSNWQKILR